MQDEDFRPPEPNGAYIGPGVTFKGEISGPDVIVVEGVVEGNVSVGELRIGPAGAVKGNVTAIEADVHGFLSEKAEIKEFLFLHASSRVEGHIQCGDLQVERGATLAGDFTVGGAKLHGTTEPLQPKKKDVPAPVMGLKLQAAE